MASREDWEEWSVIRRSLVLLVLLVVSMLLPVAALGAHKTGCPSDSSPWELVTVAQAAADFFPHLLPGQFSNVGEFAAAIDAVTDTNGNDSICRRTKAFNPNSHWSDVGAEAGLTLPILVLSAKDDSSNSES